MKTKLEYLVIILLLVILGMQSIYYSHMKSDKIVQDSYLGEITGDAVSKTKARPREDDYWEQQYGMSYKEKHTIKQLWSDGYESAAIFKLYDKMSVGGGVMRLFYNPSDPTWADENDGAMATFLGGQDRWVSEICMNKAKELGSGANEASLLIGQGGNSFAHIEGEKTTIETNNGTDHLYSVSWGANSFGCDMTFTIYLGTLNISQRIVLEAPDISEFADPDEEEKKNQTVSDFYVGYHVQDYAKACIKFESTPWCLPDFSGKELCNDITENSASNVVPKSAGPLE